MMRPALTALLCVFCSPVLWATETPPPPFWLTPPEVDEAPQEVMDDVRARLIDAALLAPVHVYSASWIDTSGVLHENTRIHSNARIQGGHLGQTLPLEGEDEDLFCGNPLNLRATANLEVRVERPRDPLQSHPPLRHLSEWMEEEILSEFNRSPDWRVFPRQVPAAANFYHSIVESRGDEERLYRFELYVRPDPQGRRSQGDLPWRRSGQVLVLESDRMEDARAVLASVNRTVSTTLGFSASPAPRMASAEIELRIYQRGDVRPFWQDGIRVAWRETRPGLHGPQFSAQTRGTLQRLAAGWVDTIAETRGCSPLRFDVLQVNGSEWMINGGSEAGLQPGDRLVLADADRIPARVLEMGVAEEMLLAEVVQTEPNRARLRTLNTLPEGFSVSAGRLVALPL